MNDEIEKNFIKSVVGFLKRKIENQSLSSDALESVEVSIQCLEAAFDLGVDENRQQQQQPGSASGSSVSIPGGSTVDVFDMFQSLYLEKNPESKELAEQIKNEGNRLMKDTKFYEALLQYTRAVTLDPKNPVFYCNRAAAYIRLGEHDKAIADCRLALTYNPDYGKAYGRMGIAYSNLHKYVEASEAFKKAIALEPNNQDYKNNLQLAEAKLNNEGNFNVSDVFRVLSSNSARGGIGGIIDTIMSNPVYASALQVLTNSEFLQNARGGMVSEEQLRQVLANLERAMNGPQVIIPDAAGGNPSTGDPNPPQPPPTS